LKGYTQENDRPGIWLIAPPYPGELFGYYREPGRETKLSICDRPTRPFLRFDQQPFYTEKDRPSSGLLQVNEFQGRRSPPSAELREAMPDEEFVFCASTNN